jgi:hypothetical protein
MRGSGVTAVTGVLALLALFAGAGPASAHSDLVASFPVADDRVDELPRVLLGDRGCVLIVAEDELELPLANASRAVLRIEGELDAAAHLEPEILARSRCGGAHADPQRRVVAVHAELLLVVARDADQVGAAVPVRRAGLRIERRRARGASQEHAQTGEAGEHQ